jgi:hypothetical protein
MSSRENKREDWAVLDSRAQYDTDGAVVLEACGHERPSAKYLSRTWGGQGAVLVRWYKWDGEQYTAEDIVEVIP